MKRHLLLFIIVFTGINGTVTAQEADGKIGNLINQTDWFALAEEYPKLKGEMQSEMLKHLSETMIGLYFNQPERAIQAIDWLLANAQEELGFGSISNLVLAKSTVLGEQGFYAESADNLSNFLTQISEQMDLKEFPAHSQTLEIYEKIRNEAKPEVIRPNRDIEIPVTIEQVGRGQLMYIPVKINGKEYKFIFDTGASSTFVSERFANETGLRIMDESFMISGIRSGVAKRGTTDSITVGDIVFKNPIITISLPNEEVDTVFQVDAVLGIDFIRRIGETQIYPEEKKIVFPVKKTELPSCGCNLLLSYGQPYLKAYSNTEKLLFHFDTGNVKTNLNNYYYEKHKEELDKTGDKKTVPRGGYGGILFVDAYQIPKFPLTVGSCNFELTNVEVLLHETFYFGNKEDGSLGMDFITTFRKVIINFDDMFVKVEK
jgi:predicted aspartyl protease